MKYRETADSIDWLAARFDPIEKLFPVKVDPIEEDIRKLRMQASLAKLSQAKVPTHWMDKDVEDWLATDFLEYFLFKWKDKVSFEYVLIQGRASGIADTKRLVDHLRSIKYTLQDVKDYIDFYFRVSAVETIELKLLLTKVNEYNVYRAKKQNGGTMESKKKFQTTQSTSDELAVLAEKQALEYYGRGWNDDKLTKVQYFVGLAWRSSKLGDTEKKYLIEWQKKKFSDEIVIRLAKWKLEFKQHKSTFDLRKAFYHVEAQREGKTLKQILEKYRAIDYLDALEKKYGSNRK